MANAHHDLALSPPRLHALRFPALDRDIDCADNETLFAAARRHGLRIVGACGGRGTCGGCMVPQRRPGAPRHRQGVRAFFAQEGLRACCVQPRSDLVVDVAPRSLAPVVRADVRTGGEDQALTCEPLVAAQDLQLPPPACRICSATSTAMRRALAQRAARAPWRWTGPRGRRTAACCARTTGGEPAQRDPRRRAAHVGFARPEAPLLGLAVDLGTTNAAAFLLDLEDWPAPGQPGPGEPAGGLGRRPDQPHQPRHQGARAAETLRQAAGAPSTPWLHDLARAVGAQAGDIADAVVCGNTAMQHLLAGWPVRNWGRRPSSGHERGAGRPPARSWA